MKIFKTALWLSLLASNVINANPKFWTNGCKGAALLFFTFAPLAAAPHAYQEAGRKEYFDKKRELESQGKLDSQTLQKLNQQLQRDKIGSAAFNLIISGIAGRSCLKWFRK